MRKATVLALCAATVGVVLVFGCTGHYTAPDSATKSLLRTHTVECVQKSTTVPIDPAIVRSLIPSQFEIYTQPDGQANIVFLFKSCTKLVVDNEDIGKGVYISHGVRITGPHEMIPVPGAAITQPTLYFYDLEDQSDNERFVEAGRESGFPYSMIRSADWVSTGTESSGTVIERENVRYSWKEARKVYSGPGPIGANLKVYHKGSVSNVQCLLRVTGRNSSTSVEAGPGSVFRRFYASSNYQGLSIDSDTVCNAIWRSSGN